MKPMRSASRCRSLPLEFARGRLAGPLARIHGFDCKTNSPETFPLVTVNDYTLIV